MADSTKWELVNPEGVPQVETHQANPHPSDLKGKTVILRWNGKHNGDIFLDRIGELLAEKVKDLKLIKAWEAESFTRQVSQSPDVSKRIAQMLKELKPDIVIGAQGD